MFAQKYIELIAYSSSLPPPPTPLPGQGHIPLARLQIRCYVGIRAFGGGLNPIHTVFTGRSFRVCGGR